MNEEAVKFFSTVETGPAAELARKGFEWRATPPSAGDRTVVEMLEKGILPLYRIFLADYERHLHDYGAVELARAFRAWRERLD